MPDFKPELESYQASVSQVQVSDALDEFRFGPQFKVLAEGPRTPTEAPQELPAPAATQQLGFDAATEMQITEGLRGLALRLQDCRNNTQRQQVLQETSQFLRLYGFHTSESAAQDFNRRMALAGAPSIQLILNPNFAQPSDPIWHLRYRSTNPPVNDHPPIILPIP